MSIQTPPETTKGRSKVELVKAASDGLLRTLPEEFAALTERAAEREAILCS
jgi:hypothetical protein